MSFLSQLDPTSRTSAFGGVVRDAINKVPGGADALAAVDKYNARARVTDRGGPSRGPGVTSEAERAGLAVPWWKRPVVIVGAVVVLLLGVVGWLLMRGRR